MKTHNYWTHGIVHGPQGLQEVEKDHCQSHIKLFKVACSATLVEAMLVLHGLYYVLIYIICT